MLPTSAGVEPATSWSPVGRRIQLSHRGRQLGIVHTACNWNLCLRVSPQLVTESQVLIEFWVWSWPVSQVPEWVASFGFKFCASLGMHFLGLNTLFGIDLCLWFSSKLEIESKGLNEFLANQVCEDDLCLANHTFLNFTRNNWDWIHSGLYTRLGMEYQPWDWIPGLNFDTKFVKQVLFLKPRFIAVLQTQDSKPSSKWAHLFHIWQNQQNGMRTQRRLRSAWASAQSDQSLCLR